MLNELFPLLRDERDAYRVYNDADADHAILRLSLNRGAADVTQAEVDEAEAKRRASLTAWYDLNQAAKASVEQVLGSENLTVSDLRRAL